MLEREAELCKERDIVRIQDFVLELGVFVKILPEDTRIDERD